MLGSAITKQLKLAEIETLTASRTTGIKFDATSTDFAHLFKEASLAADDYVINCIGLTKARIDESSISSRELAVKLNVDFPTGLAKYARETGVKVIQVATDCVFSGNTGGYTESSPHDAMDVYGKTKSLGEIPSEAVMHLRCSLIGPESGRNSLFFEWVRKLPAGASVKGFTNHLWNGLTSDTFGRITAAIIRNSAFRSGIQHLVPLNIVTKEELVKMELNALGRNDVKVEAFETEQPIDRTLSTEDSEFNQRLFDLAGYPKLPTIEQMLNQMVAEMAD